MENTRKLLDYSEDENKESIRVASNLVKNAIANNQPLNETLIEEASAVVHEEWLRRNLDHASAEEQLPYPQMSEDTKDKDRFFVRQAIADER